MKKFTFPVFMLLVCTGYNTAMAQNAQQNGNSYQKYDRKKEETIIINGAGKDKVEIEIKDGSLFINGEVQSAIEDTKNEDHKIVININTDQPAPVHHNMDAAPRKAMLGVYTNSDDANGAKITGIVPNSAADDAGLKRGDVITQIDGRDIKNSSDLVAVLGGYNAGDKVNINYIRNGYSQMIRTELSPSNTESRLTFRWDDNDRNDPPPTSSLWNIPFGNGKGLMFYNNDAPKIGITAQNAEDERGVEVTEVKPGSPAEKARLQKGDIIERLDYDHTNTADDIQYILNNVDVTHKIKLVYKRKGEMITTYLNLAPNGGKKEL